MSFTTVPTVSNGDSWSAAQHNTYLRDNLAALWPFTTAGDIAYASAANALARLGIGAAGTFLQRVAGVPGYAGFGTLGFSVDYHANSTGHSYSTNSFRDMPNSSKNVTLTVQSTIVCVGFVTQYATDSPNYYGFFENYFSINGTNITQLTMSSQYGNGIEPRMVIGYKAGVPSGTRTIKLRERCGSGSYDVTQIQYLVLIVPDA